MDFETRKQAIAWMEHGLQMWLKIEDEMAAGTFGFATNMGETPLLKLSESFVNIHLILHFWERWLVCGLSVKHLNDELLSTVLFSVQMTKYEMMVLAC